MPKEDIRLFAKAQKKDYARCLPPSMDCDEEPIRAHSIQNARVLDLIQTDGHVLMPRYKLVTGETTLRRSRASARNTTRSYSRRSIPTRWMSTTASTVVSSRIAPS